MREGDRLGGRFLLYQGPLRGGSDHAGEVWLAHDERMGRDVVLKQAEPVADQPVGELRAMAKFNHQHVVTLYEYFSVAGEGDWLVMEYAPQGSLADQPRMSPEQAARVGAQIASALVHLHTKGIVHCDVKPANIVIAENGAAKLTDFGAAYRVGSQETITPQTRISHTPAYAAPEVVRGSPVQNSDVYSLATTVYALVVGESPNLPGHDERTAELGPLRDVLSAMRRRNPGDRPDAARAQRMFENVAAGLDPMTDHWSSTTVQPETSTSGTPIAPAQLPTDVYGFAGRDNELGQLDRLLASAAEEQSTAVVIAAVSGTAGVGKTALAVHWAHRVADRFPDGQLYVNLRGFDPSGQVLDPGAAVRGFLEALGAAPERVPTELDAQTALYRSLLVGKKVLVVLDNAHDTHQIRPLLPGTPGCLVLVTSRNDLTGLITREGAHPLALDQLTASEAHQLLERRLGHDRTVAEPDAVGDIIAACARLPLALAIVAARAATRPRFPLTALVSELRHSHARLDALAAESPDTDVRAVFSWSYQQLTPEAARLFRLLGLHPGPDLSASAAASLAGVPLQQVRPLLAELTRAHVVGEPAPGRYAFHDLLRAYATELTNIVDTESERQSAQHRMLDHYLHTIGPAALLLYPHGDRFDVRPVAGVTVDELPNHRQAMAWASAEHTVLLAIVDYAANAGFDTHTWQLAWSVSSFLDHQGRWQDRVHVWNAALEAARRLNDVAVRARAYRNLASSYGRLRRFDDAHANVQDALRLHEDLGDQAGQAHDRRILGVLYEREGRHDEALRQAQHALSLYEAIEHRAGQADILNNIGWYQAQLGHYDKTVASCLQALPLLHELGEPAGEAATWDSLGFARHHLGDHHEAIHCYQQALELIGDHGKRDDKATILDHLGDAHDAVGDQQAARASWQQALAIYEEIAPPDAEAVRTKLRSFDQPLTD